MIVVEPNRTQRFFRSPLAERELNSWPVTREPQAFHQRLPGYTPTPLRDAPDLASRLGLARLWVKDESFRLGLPAFKILGASWAVYRALDQELARRTGQGFTSWDRLDDLARQVAALAPLTLACATDGNHGRAVARMARLLGLDAQIFVPADMSEARRQAIASEGAVVTVVEGTYDDAVARSAEVQGPRCLVISDTAWPGYEAVPRWVIEGYSTILWEVEDALAARGEPGPDLVAVQIGVGALAAAITRHFRRPGAPLFPEILGVEPARAACMLASMEAGQIVQVPGPHDSIMSGLNCGVPSAIAWPVVSRGIDAFIAIDDEWARVAMRLLADEGIVAGECGAAGVAGLLAWAEAFGGDLRGRRALVLITEGATDPDAYRQIVGQQP
jgi:diaminopropionate ammonia-lyase